MRVLLCLTFLIGGVLAACTTRPVTSSSTSVGTPTTVDPKADTTTTSKNLSSSEATSATTTTQPTEPSPTGPKSLVDEAGDDDCSTTYDSTISTTALVPQTTTLPNVSVSVVEFSLHSCDNAVCTYTYLAPVNDPVFLDTEQNVIDNDYANYTYANDEVEDFNATVGKMITNATNQVDGLRKQLELAQENLNTIQYELKQLIWNTNNASSNLMAVNYYIDRYIDRSQPCYWSCTLPPTTPAPPTTTTSPTPTTPDMCFNNDFGCPSGTVCQIRSAKPFCDNCPGNMDGYKKCNISFCSAAGVNATAGVFWSPGFDGTNGTLDPNLSCQWNYYGIYNFSTDAGSYNVDILGQTSDTPLAILIPHDGSGPYTIYKSTNFKKLNSQIKEVQDFTILLTTPNAQQPLPSFFFWKLNAVSTSTSTPE